MNNISIELVPRDAQKLELELQLVKETYKKVDTINIPDVKRYDIRSWDAAVIARKYFDNVIPHIRATDIDGIHAKKIIELLHNHSINKVLIIQGDNGAGHELKTTSIDLIKFFFQYAPDIKVYAGVDPYRSSIKKEQEYIKQKIEAGAFGFFTQPFFDFRLLDIYADVLEGVDVYWGITPVITSESKKYWEDKNNVVFPKDFTVNIEWSRNLLKKMLDAITEKQGGNVYVMPIKVNLENYLKDIL